MLFVAKQNESALLFPFQIYQSLMDHSYEIFLCQTPYTSDTVILT